MAIETQTKLVGFCLGNKANYNATNYANHIWFDPTNKQILLNGIEYIPKKLSELVNDKNFITSITKAMVENVLTGNITSHTHSYLPLSGGTMSNTNLVTNLNADLLDGYHATYGNNKPWGTIPVITAGGYMDVGKHFEFHYDNTTGSDYSTVLACTGNYGNIVNLPSASGKLALLTDNVASASKWATPRTITLTGSVTGSVSIDGSQNVSLATTTNHTHNEYLPLTGGTLSGDLTCNGDYINMNNDSGSRGYRGFFNQSNNTNRASGSHIFMGGGGYALGTNSVSIGYQAYAGIRNEDADKTTYPYIAWQWMPTAKFMVDTTNSAKLSGGRYYGFPLLPNEMVQWNIGGQKVIYENSSSYNELLVVIKASDADTGLVFGGKTTLPYRASKTLIAGKYIVGSGEYLKKIDEYTINGVKYYQVIIYTWNTNAFPTSYDFTQQVKVMCATKVSNSNYSGASSYASGYYSVASGVYSVASGFSSVASGNSSVASGNYSVASGSSSVASGAYSVASGAYSVASGYHSVASGAYSVVLARNGETMSSYQTIVGKFNAKVAGLFIIGNGTSKTARSNAFVVDDSGNVTAKYFSGYANAIGGEGIKVYATNSDEINFGGTSSSTTIYFGYRSMDSRPTPTTYNFGKGTATIQAAAFTGNAATATNADTLDGYHASNLVKFYLSPMSSGAPADSAKSWFIDTMPAGTGAIVYNVPGSEKTIIAGKSTGAHGHMLQLNYDDNYLRILRYVQGGWKTTDWEKISAGYADTATALTSSAGSATQPIYFSNGKPVACTYTLAKSVPSNAVFTDTTYSVATASADGLMSAAMYKAEKVSSISVRQGAVQFEEPIRNHNIYVTYDKDKALNSDNHMVGGDVRIKIPNATKNYDGSMSYTDKRKLDGISSYAPKKVVALRLSYTYGSVTVISGGGDYDMTQDAELMQSASSDGVEENSNGIHYYTTFSLDTTAASTNTLNNLFRNSFVKFSFMGKDTSYVPDTVDVKSSFNGNVLYVVFSSLDSQETWVVDCVWEFF